MRKTLSKYFILVLLVFTANSAFAFRQAVHNHYTSEDGCEYDVNSWVEVSAQWSPPFFHTSHYHIVVSTSKACGGNHEFNGFVSSGSSPDDYSTKSGMAIKGTLINSDTGEEENISSCYFISPLLAWLQEQYHDEQGHE